MPTPFVRPFVAVTSGDPAGIGPEIVARLFGRYRSAGSIALILGAPELFEPWACRFRFRPPVVTSIGEAQRLAVSRPVSRRPRVILLDTGVRGQAPLGRDSETGGRHAGAAILLACELANNHSVGAIVTPPISKKALNLGHFDFPGHTEMLARYLNAPNCQMMMVRRHLRVVPFTRHIPVSRVAGFVTADRLEICIRVTAEALRRDFKISRPRIAVAGLNPHAGEDGVIGPEDRDVIAPLVARLRKTGLDVSGPHPADSMFQSAPEAARAPAAPRRGSARTGSWSTRPPVASYYDAYIAMYHDQGLVPFKMLAQRRGVNVTVGLPVPRTSVDHGTAYDIAGKGIAESESLLEAYRLAETMMATPRRKKK
ncbi:MAG: 4-hydroxythreonine-4-phosphate dehydrogenase PdxA [Candidatus Krumholzibacteria bacterium]|nr:4-hydroxythreonine-4-phosphate dehydrogenase PdxA [Candidatus Krumholzibacteria bacterium]MDH5271220.1 4-hydroxythreonine-4-phosphate dehydrogenase PdxA [Candidatus Krumholzibacteria bacterium]MDH5627726.1 4-hydroxythreonine-4-phosphate dehydrogenase PdxA [Candidatus Krumholzibacteria bacterium]